MMNDTSFTRDEKLLKINSFYFLLQIQIQTID